MDNMVCEPKPKVSASKSVVFRPGAQLRSDLDQLAAELSRPGADLTISDILRDGVTAFWPQIRSYIRTQAQIGAVNPIALDAIVAAGTRAHQLGLTPAEIEAALETALAAKLTPSAP